MHIQNHLRTMNGRRIVRCFDILTSKNPFSLLIKNNCQSQTSIHLFIYSFISEKETKFIHWENNISNSAVANEVTKKKKCDPGHH